MWYENVSCCVGIELVLVDLHVTSVGALVQVSWFGWCAGVGVFVEMTVVVMSS